MVNFCLGAPRTTRCALFHRWREIFAVTSPMSALLSGCAPSACLPTSVSISLLVPFGDTCFDACHLMQAKQAPKHHSKSLVQHVVHAPVMVTINTKTPHTARMISPIGLVSVMGPIADDTSEFRSRLPPVVRQDAEFVNTGGNVCARCLCACVCVVCVCARCVYVHVHGSDTRMPLRMSPTVSSRQRIQLIAHVTR